MMTGIERYKSQEALEKHREGVRRWRRNNPEKVREYTRLSNRRTGDAARNRIALYWGDNMPRCRADLTPELLTIHCAGRLEIDHIKEHGREESKAKGNLSFYASIAKGKRDVDDLRILCQLHNYYAFILSGGEWR